MANPQKLNRLIRELQSEGYTYPTEYAYISDAYARIVVPTGRKDAGTIRTMQQANDYLTKKYGSQAILFTEETYEQELNELRSQLGNQITRKGFISKVRGDLTSIVHDMEEAIGEEIDISRISTEKLRDAIEYAGRMAKSDSNGSPTFYQYLYEYLSWN